MKADDFLQFAISLSNNFDTQSETGAASCRSIISRSYYACFHIAKKIIREHYSGKWPSGGSAHKFIEEIFVHSQNSDLVLAGQLFKTLRTQRRFADYDLEKSQCDSIQQARLHLMQANEFIKIINVSEKDDLVQYRMIIQGIQRGVNSYNQRHRGI